MAKPKAPAAATAARADDDPLRAEAAAAVANPDRIRPQELAQRLADPAFRDRVEDAIANLPPDKAAELVVLLEASIRRRKVELIGYLAAAAVLLVGMVVALYAYGAAAEGRFVGWVFMIPLALAGLVMMVVGRLARRAEAAERAGQASATAKPAVGKPGHKPGKR